MKWEGRRGGGEGGNEGKPPVTLGEPGRNSDGWLVCVRRYYLLCEWGEMAAAQGDTPAGLQGARTAVTIDLEACYLGLQERLKRQLIKKEGFMIFSPSLYKQTATSYVFLTQP